MPKLLPGLFAIIILLSGCAEPRLDESSFMGMRQSEIRATLGEPDSIEVLHRHTDHVWGPIEDLWADLKPGERIVVWTYTRETGRKQLYFLNESDEVAAEFFWHTDSDRNPVF